MDDSFNYVVNEGGAAVFASEAALYYKGSFMTQGNDFPAVVVPER